MPKVAFVAINRVGVAPGVKTDPQRSLIKSAILAKIEPFAFVKHRRRLVTCVSWLQDCVLGRGKGLDVLAGPIYGQLKSTGCGVVKIGSLEGTCGETRED